MTFVIKFSLFFFSFPILSRVWGVITKIEFPQIVVKSVIRLYVKAYDISMDKYQGEISSYKSLGKFFIRPLDETVFKLKKNEDAFLSPSDGKVTALEKLSEDKTTLVKGKTYSVSDLVKDDIDFSNDWHLTTIYLSPKDYHRFHLPVDADIETYTHVGTKLYPVNNLSVKNIDNLFTKNERVSLKMRYNNNIFYYVAVGATFVGSIKMGFEPNLKCGKHIPVNKKVSQCDELGMFEMGSTIVLILPGKMIKECKIEKGQDINVGDLLFNLNKD